MAPPFLFPGAITIFFLLVRAKNIERAAGGAKPGIPVDLIPGAKDGPGGGGSAKRGKANTKGALELVQQSTASMGK